MAESNSKTEPPSFRIFICYRRDETAAYAGRVYDALAARFGKESVFIDIDVIRPGSDFEAALDGELSRCKVMLTFIGRSWIAPTITSPRGRLDNANDYVRRELETALSRGIVIIPLLVQNAVMPSRDQLPDTLQPLASRQAVELPDVGWSNGMRILLDELDQLRQNSTQSLDPNYAPLRGRRIGRRTILIGGISSAALIGATATGVAFLRDTPGTAQQLLPQTTAAGSVRKVAAAGYHNAALMNDGTIRTWGDNSGGELGDGSIASQRSRPTVVSSITGANSVAASVFHALAIVRDGVVAVWGENQFGQLGDGTTRTHLTAVPISSLPKVAAVAAGGFWGTDGRNNSIKYAHSLAIAEDETVYAWGSNHDGQLGDRTNTERHTPAPIAGLAGAKAVSAGATHSIALLGDRTVRVWGDNGLRGPSGTENANRAANLVPVQVEGLSDVIGVAAGCFHSVAVTSNGTVMTWGWNAYGQLGDGTTTDRPSPVPVVGLTDAVAVAAGDRFSLALLASGQVRAWGANEKGQLGDGSFNDQTSPVNVVGLSDAAAISASFLHGLALLRSGRLMAWGDNSSGQLGDGTSDNRDAPVTVLGFQ